MYILPTYNMDRCDTSSTTTSSMSGVRHHMFKSPAPICTFYFSHPFGVSTPLVSQNFINTASPPTKVKHFYTRKKKGKKLRRSNTSCSSVRSAVLIPWPRTTWNCEYVLPPVLQVMAKQHGRKLPDIENILKTVHQAWNTPNSRSSLQSRDNTSSSSNWDLISTSEPYSKINQHKREQQQYTTNMIITTHYPSISGAAGIGLLKRRYSVPEIIMRKHTLAQQQTYEDSVAATAPAANQTPIPTRKSSSYTTTTTQTSVTRTTGSDTNLSRTPYSPSNIYGSKHPARKSSLLRHLFNKELKKHEASIRSENNSPSNRRNQRRLYHRGSGESVPCEECQKLNISHGSSSSNLIADFKRPKLTHSSSSIRTADEDDEANDNVTQSAVTSAVTPTANHQSSNSSKAIESTTTVSNITNSSRDIPTNSSPEENHGYKVDESPAVDPTKRSVLIYMTSLEKTAEDEDSAQDMLRVEIQEPNFENTDHNQLQNYEPDQIEQICEKQQTNIEFLSEARETPLSDENANELDRVKNSDISNEELSQFYKSALGRIKFYRDEDENVYISKILIDNLNNISDTVNDRLIIDGQKYFDQLETNLPQTTAATENIKKKDIRIIRAQQIIKEGSSTHSQSPVSSKESTRSIKLNSKMQVIETELGMSALQINDIINIQTIHYFPDYYADNRADLSSHTSQCSEPEAVELVPVNTGSTYPMRGVHDIILSRLSAFPRTESMEVQPPSTSLGDRLGEDDDVGNLSDVSLVDSLDDPVSPAVKGLQRVYKSPEAFFVPIVDAMQQVDEHLDVADAMPDALRERLMNRQKRLMSKERKGNKKPRKGLGKAKGIAAVEDQENKKNVGNEINKKSDKLPSVPRKVITKPRKLLQNNNKKTQMQSELGMLESYKIDSRGNMQIQTQANKKEHVTNSEKTIKPTRKPVTTKTTKLKTSEHFSFKKLPPEKKQAKPTQLINKGVEKLTFYPPADLTPDVEGGPKRMYQKTEIQQDGKTIEILEIVECTQENYSSEDESSPTSEEMSDENSKKVKSKIPIPVIKPISRTEKIADYSPENSPTESPSMPSGKSSFKKIAGLLLEALQSPDDMGVEFIKSPKDLNGKSKKGYTQRQTQGGCSFYIPGPKPRSVNSNRYLQKFDVIPEERTSFSIESSDEVAAMIRRDAVVKTKTLEEATTIEVEDTQENERSSKESTPESFVKLDSEENFVETAASIEEYALKITSPVRASSGDAETTQQLAVKASSNETLVWTDVFKQHGNGNPLESANDLEGTNHIYKYNYNSYHLPPITPSISTAPTTSSSISIANSTLHPFESDRTFKKYKTAATIEKWTANGTSTFSTLSLSSSTSFIATTTSSSIAQTKSYKNSTNSELRACPSSESENILTIIEKTMLHSVLATEESASLLSDDYLTDCLNTDNCEQCNNYISEKRLMAKEAAPGVMNSSPKVNGASRMLLSPKLPSPVALRRRSLDPNTARQLSNHSTPIKPTRTSPIHKTTNSTAVLVSSCENAWRVPDTAPEQNSPAKEKLKKEHQNQTKELESKAKENEKPVVTKKSPVSPRKSNGVKKESLSSKETIAKKKDTASTKTVPKTADSCNSCCFCNPELHKSGSNVPPVVCNYCSSTNASKTGTSKSKPDTSPSSTGTTKYYESLSKSDHVHTKTRSKDSDTVSTRCTKTNERIKRAYIPSDEGGEKATKKSESPVMSRRQNLKKDLRKTDCHLNRPKETNQLPHRQFTTAKDVHKKSSKTNSVRDKQKSTFRLPSPNAISASSSTHDERPCSVESDSSPICSPVKNSYQILPMATSSASRWQNNKNPRFASEHYCSTNRRKVAQTSHQHHYRQELEYQNSMNHFNNNHQSQNHNGYNNNNNNNFSSSQPPPPLPAATVPGWSVTVAGNYNPEMAPDVDLKLSFPKNGQKQGMVVSNNNNNKCNNPTTGRSNPIVNGQVNSSSCPQQNQNVCNLNNNYGDEEYYDYHQNEKLRLHQHHHHQEEQFEEEEEDFYVSHNKRHPPAIAPAIQNLQKLPDNYNLRRTLSRADNRGAQIGNNSLQRSCQLPGVNGHSSNINTNHVTRQTAKKAIKRVECSVAVTSATTRTISNMPRGRVGGYGNNGNTVSAQKSFQALNQPVGVNKQNTLVRGVLQRDRSLDVRNSNLTQQQRRMSLDERTSSNGSDMLATLSVMGNSIAPEHKPKVPTMSERDLTGRHNSCFTRTRPFLS